MKKKIIIMLFGLVLTLALAACAELDSLLAGRNPGAPGATAATTVAATAGATGQATTGANTPAATTAPATVAATQAPPTATPKATPTPDKSPAIRATRWLEVLKNDPALKPEPVSGTTDFYLRIQGTEITGIPQLNAIEYLDLDGDKVEEAALPLFSGGTAGNIAFLVFKATPAGPKMVDWDGGYKLGLKLENGRLVAVNALYAGWEPNCCPSGFSFTAYSLKNDKLVATGERKEGLVEAQQPTVEHFYDLLNAGEFEDAYELLGNSYRLANPFGPWSAGFATTKEIVYEARPEPGAANTIRINLTSTDFTNGGGTVTRRFTGTWKMVFNPNLNGWTLNDPAIKEVEQGNPGGKIHPALQPAIAVLKKSAGVPILLPTFIESGGLPVYARVTAANASGYTVELELDPQCQGANACRLGSVAAGSNSGPALAGTPVKLANGLQGYFQDFSCGASCSEATLSWQQGNTRYRLALKAGKQETLVKMANSALAFGPVK